jgi:hypothetical protein
MQMEMEDRLLRDLTGRADQIHPGRMQGAIDRVPDYEYRGGQLLCGALVGVPQIRDMNPGNDERVTWGGGFEREERDPRTPFADDLSRRVCATGDRTKWALL